MTAATPYISDEYAALNGALLRGDVGYGCGGRRHARAIAAYARELGVMNILDYGCGCGVLAKALPKSGWPGLVRQYDPSVPEKARLPKRSGLVVCLDVLEHVEPERLDAVLAHLRRLTVRGAYIAIATRRSNKTLADGRNAHLSIHPAAWWLGKLSRHWRITRIVQRGVRGVTVWLTT